MSVDFKSIAITSVLVAVGGFALYSLSGGNTEEPQKQSKPEPKKRAEKPKPAPKEKAKLTPEQEQLSKLNNS